MAATTTYQGRPCKYGHDGIRYKANRRCVECNRLEAKSPKGKLRAKQWREANPDKDKRSRKMYAVKKKYGITSKQYDLMLSAQNYECSICSGLLNNPAKVHVDHCHKTGKVRSLLCDLCNKGLGHFKDSAPLLRLAADYLDKHNGKYDNVFANR